MEARLVEDPGLSDASRRSAGGRAPVVSVMGNGGQKAATSWLFRCLVEHPGFRGSVREGGDKGNNFFNRYHEYGYDWYERQFDVGDWQNMEFLVLYFHDRNVPARVHRYNPDARLVLCLRNPVDRALSQYRHEIRKGRLSYDPDGFFRAVRRNPSYAEQGLYARNLQNWLEFFDLDRFNIIDYDDVVEFDAVRALKTGEGMGVGKLRSGDHLVVPTAHQFTWRTALDMVRTVSTFILMIDLVR